MDKRFRLNDVRKTSSLDCTKSQDQSGVSRVVVFKEIVDGSGQYKPEVVPPEPTDQPAGKRRFMRSIVAQERPSADTNDIRITVLRTSRASPSGR